MDNYCPLLLVLVMARSKKRFLIRDHYRHDHYAVHWGIDFNRGTGSYYLNPFDGFHAFPIYGPSPFAWVPPKQKRGNWMHGTSHTTLIPAPTLSQVDDLISKLETQIKNNNPEELAKLLRADFIFELHEMIVEKRFHIDIPAEVQGNVYTYRVCDAQPNIELLILEHNKAFRQLLAQAKEADLKNAATAPNETPSLYRTILRQLKNLHLEGADLSELDLDDADLSHSQCKKANFRKSTLLEAICINTDLQDSGITKKQLGSCKTYADAKLDLGFWLYWTENTKNKVISGLNDLRAYGKKLQNKGIAKGEEAVKLADKLTADINEPNVKYNEAFQQKFLKDLHSQDKLFDTHRSYKRIIANIALCIVSGLIGYLIAGALNKRFTGNFTFFAKTTSHKKVEVIDQAFTHDTPQMTNFLLGTHPKIGKKSSIRSFFGHTRSKPEHPIGDAQVLPLIKGFLY